MTFDPKQRFASRVTEMLSALVRDDGGQDLIEYAYLAGFVAIVGYVTLTALVPAVGSAYAVWIDPNTGSPSLWQPAEPWSITSAS